MSISSRITSIEGHIEDDYNALTRLGVDLTNVDKNIENIASVVDDIYDKLPKVTGTGSDLSLTPTLKGALGIVPLGNCEQDSYSGKNLAQVDGTNKTLNNTLVVSKVNQAINLNGSTSISGTFYSSFEVNGDNRANYGVYITPTNVINLVAGSYTLSIANKTGSYTNVESIFLLLIKKNATTPNTQIAQLNVIDETSKTVTIANDGEYYLSIQITGDESSNVTFTNYSFNLMLEQGSTATTYEPYTNGPSPNPSYPQDVKVVTGDNQVLVQNKNAFNYATFPDLIVQENGSIKAGKGFNDVDSKIFKGKPNTQYTISMRNTNMELDDTGFSVGFPNYVNTTTTGYYTFTTDSKGEIEYKVGARGNSVVNQYEKYIQIEIGSTATSYVAHQEQSTTLHLGSNYLASIPNTDYKDEIDVENKKIIRKVEHIASYNGETITTDYISTTGELSTGAEVYYGLNEPTEEPITDTTLINDLNNLQELLSYDGTTNITITSASNNAQMLVLASALKGE